MAAAHLGHEVNADRTDGDQSQARLGEGGGSPRERVSTCPIGSRQAETQPQGHPGRFLVNRVGFFLFLFVAGLRRLRLAATEQPPRLAVAFVSRGGVRNAEPRRALVRRRAKAEVKTGPGENRRPSPRQLRRTKATKKNVSVEKKIIKANPPIRDKGRSTVGAVLLGVYLARSVHANAPDLGDFERIQNTTRPLVRLVKVGAHPRRQPRPRWRADNRRRRRLYFQRRSAFLKTTTPTPHPPPPTTTTTTTTTVTSASSRRRFHRPPPGRPWPRIGRQKKKNSRQTRTQKRQSVSSKEETTATGSTRNSSRNSLFQDQNNKGTRVLNINSSSRKLGAAKLEKPQVEINTESEQPKTNKKFESMRIS